MASNTQLNAPVSRQSQTPAATEPSLLARFIDCMTAFKQGAALKGAIELDLFTILADGSKTAESLALRLQASARGVRILCDYLSIDGFLTKEDGRYSVTPDAVMFLSRKSPNYMGSAASFLGNTMLIEHFGDIAGCVRKGGTVNAEGTLRHEHPIWVEFARSMAPIAAIDAEFMARSLKVDSMRKCKVLDIAAGHGMYGIAIGQSNPNAKIVALDWKNVLPVARQNAEKAGIGSRYRTIEGDAFDVDFGEGYDIVLLTGFLHHFSEETNATLLRKIYRSMQAGGRVVTLGFVPNEDRPAPAIPAEFALMMLATTPEGDAYTFAKCESMLSNAGFRSTTLHEIPFSPQRVVIGSK